MRTVLALVAAAMLTAARSAPQSSDYTGVITDTMCKRDHAHMNVTPEAKCVRDCGGDGKTYKYALLVGKNLHVLSDQETPPRFAAQRVIMKGVLYGETNILKVESIRPVR